MRTKQNTNLTIHIKDFGDDVGYVDKISLKYKWEEGKPWDKKYYIYDFRLDPNSQTPTIQRRKCETDSIMNLTNCGIWQNSVSVEGGRSGEVTDFALAEALRGRENLIKLR